MLGGEAKDNCDILKQHCEKTGFSIIYWMQDPLVGEVRLEAHVAHSCLSFQ